MYVVVSYELDDPVVDHFNCVYIPISYKPSTQLTLQDALKASEKASSCFNSLLGPISSESSYSMLLVGRPFGVLSHEGGQVAEHRSCT